MVATWDPNPDNFSGLLLFLARSQNPKQSAARTEGSTVKPTVKRVKPAIGQNHSKVLRWKPKAPGWVNRGWKGSVDLDHIGGFPLKQVGEGHLAHWESKIVYWGQIKTHLSGKLLLPDGCHRLKVGVELGEDGQRHLRGRWNKDPERVDME